MLSFYSLFLAIVLSVVLQFTASDYPVGIFKLFLQELFTFPEHMIKVSGFSVVRVVRSFVFCLVVCSSLFVILSFSFGHCIVYLSSIYNF